MRFEGLDELLNKQMSRKQFVAHVGSGLLVVLGLSGLVKALMGNKRSPQMSAGYGSSAYGGHKR